ncbi:MAG: EAL domain-containing protein [Glaciecola sp.]
MTQLIQASPHDIDSLTGLPNRYAGAGKVIEACNQIGIQNLSAIAFELQRFGKINNSIGNKLGDKILKLMTKRLQKVFPHAVVFYRTHGDQFFMLFDNTNKISEEMMKLFDFVQRPFAVQGHVIVLNIRMGIAQAPHKFQQAEELVHAAELALHKSKTGIEKARAFNSTMVTEAKEHHQIANDLRVAIVTYTKEFQQGLPTAEFFIKYQAIMDKANKSIYAYEAKLYWRHPVRGVLEADDFISVAEEIGAMQTIGAWLLKIACKDASAWNKGSKKGDRIGVCIDVGVSQLVQQKLFLKLLNDALVDTSSDPNIVFLQVQGLQLLPAHVYDVFSKIRGIGCKIVLNYFGTGSISISQLTELPFNFLKTDRSVLNNLGARDPAKKDNAFKVMQAIKGLAETLGFEIICNNVENDAELALIEELGISRVQGDHCSEAVELSTLLKIAS